MSWRVIVVSNRAKLELKLGYLVVRGETTTKVHISEIAVVIVESTAVSLTASLLCELVKQKVKVIFCDEGRNPQSELTPYYGCHDCSARLKQQIAWKESTKEAVWTEIVTEKINKQKDLLARYEIEACGKLDEYLKDIKPGDATNREGHAAKVYFNALFGPRFSRAQDCSLNAALNYGYSILLSAFNREIVANGYLTQLGVYHDNMFNKYNLGSDLMEPFRPLVDEVVYLLQPSKLEKQEKMQLVNLLNAEIKIDGRRQYVSQAIKIFCKSVLTALNENDIGQIKFYRYELPIYENNCVF